jgi:hypothetical protein
VTIQIQLQEQGRKEAFARFRVCTGPDRSFELERGFEKRKAAIYKQRV